MLMILNRTKVIADALLGEITVDNTHVCWTLERTSVAIPAGTYAIALYPSPHFGQLMPLLVDVPSREDILIHWGNYPINSDGCILVGKTQDPSTGDIFSTREQWAALNQAIVGAIDAHEPCSITVIDIPTVS